MGKAFGLFSGRRISTDQIINSRFKAFACEHVILFSPKTQDKKNQTWKQLVQINDLWFAEELVKRLKVDTAMQAVLSPTHSLV